MSACGLLSALGDCLCASRFSFLDRFGDRIDKGKLLSGRSDLMQLHLPRGKIQMASPATRGHVAIDDLSTSSALPVEIVHSRACRQ